MIDTIGSVCIQFTLVDSEYTCACQSCEAKLEAE